MLFKGELNVCSLSLTLLGRKSIKKTCHFKEFHLLGNRSYKEVSVMTLMSTQTTEEVRDTFSEVHDLLSQTHGIKISKPMR